ncbi:hypothetical protein NDU88_002376 [Pleurodeles waltl]|uniref:Uncharacterized protein n=1 Tax=Pleurodeles waltl TaxID=8319 RepID=A0AAV7SAS0_PLEWA|nr:hypothetical protein NDU88_002376 [Pleurodeles waltl]
MAVTSAALRIITAGAPVHWLLGPIGSKVNQCSIAPRSTTTYRDRVQRQRSYPTIPLSQHRQLGQLRRWRNPLVYRPLVDLLTMEERHVIVTYWFDRATIQELCTQLEPDLMSPIRHPTGIPPDEDGPDDSVVAPVEPVEPVDSDEEEAEEEDNDNRESVIQQYFQ